MKLPSLLSYFSKFEIILWSVSVFTIVSTFAIFDRSNYLALLASLIGVTALILTAKGNLIAHALFIVFSLIYAYISFTFSYYGEMLTYLCMSGPMSAYALIEWILHPYSKGDNKEVKVNSFSKREFCLMLFFTAAVTVSFYFILKYFNTANLVFSTLSIATSFSAVYLTARRSPFYALAYALNDIILIVLWVLATLQDISYISVLICFTVFLANDLYGFYAWKKMQARQSK